MKICQNIDLVQIDIPSNYSEAQSYGMRFQLPKNVDWANRVVDKIVVAAPNTYRWDGTGVRPRFVYEYIKSPNNGVSVLGSYDYQQLVKIGVDAQETILSTQGVYFDLYKKGGDVIAKNLSLLSLLSRNNNVLEINSQLDLEQSSIYIPGKFLNAGCMLLYVFYGGHEDSSFEYPTENISVKLSLAGGQKMSFSDIINNYVHIQPNKIRGIHVWAVNTFGSTSIRPGSDAGVFFTLRDFNRTYSINNVLDTIFTAYGYQPDEISAPKRSHLYFDADVDFDNSYLQNGYQDLSTAVTIIFEY